MIHPTIGRIVHYTNLGDEQQAAIVTGVRDDDRVCLHIFYPTGQFNMDDVPYSETYARGHWSWPPKV